MVDNQSGASRKVPLKLENLQFTGAFAARGILDAALNLRGKVLARSLVGYGEMHGLAVAYAGHVLEVPIVVYLPSTATEGAQVPDRARSESEAQRLAARHASKEGLTYIAPPINRDCLVGCATIGLEILEFPELDTLVAPVGFGLLAAGVATLTKAARRDTQVFGVDQVLRCVEPGRRPGALGQRATPLTIELVRRSVDDVVLVSEAELNGAARVVWSELEVRTDPLGASAVATLLGEHVQVGPHARVRALVGSSGGQGLFG
ncbi:MAG: pyridoxal-phosphate dependent enzyme [Chloroflexi bacterium]|nr:pyridoxal-phosphate dependent enzyme [Chloroflexota bacterium]